MALVNSTMQRVQNVQAVQNVWNNLNYLNGWNSDEVLPPGGTRQHRLRTRSRSKLSALP